MIPKKMRFFARLEQLFDEDLGPWIALAAAAVIVLAMIHMGIV
jgi:hypothetical protein